MLVVGALSSPALGAVAYDESVSGDLSNSGLSPTPVTFLPGSNLISGTSGKNSAGVVDRDYFTFTLDPNEYLTGIMVLPGTTPIGFSFLGIQSGNQVTVSPTGGTATGLLGWTHYSLTDVGTDILPRMGIPAKGSSGFTPPLGPGSYSVWVQEASPGTANYRFNFLVALVPEPSAWAMMLIGFGAIGIALRGRRTTVPELRGTAA
jgi:hypothetical protein